MVSIRERAGLNRDGATGARLVAWLVRLLWVAMPFTVGPALADALDAASTPVRAVASLGLWLGWSLGLVASLVPHPISLTTLRVLAPAAVAASIVAAIDGHGSALAAGWAALAAAWAYSPPFGEWCVNGPAYPNERRYLLRAPGALLAGPLLLAWAIAVFGLTAGPLLLAARQWVLGAILSVVGLPLAALLLRSLHGLARRWAVFVPAGFVLHDPVTLVDPVFFPRPRVVMLGPARVGTTALDLSQKSPGLTLELALADVVSITLMKPGQRQGETKEAERLLFTPTRPGAVVDEARKRRIPTP